MLKDTSHNAQRKWANRAFKFVALVSLSPNLPINVCRSSLDSREKDEYGNSPFFGINLGIDDFGGKINVGDQVYVISEPKKSYMIYLLLIPLPIIAMFYVKKLPLFA